MPGELILTVDDEVKIGELIGLYLLKDGFRHRTATSGKQALEIVEKERPSLIVLDVFLPDIEGYELCAKLRKETDVPILFLTCKESEMDKVIGLTVGADDFVSKPFSPVELIARIKALLRRDRIVQERRPVNDAVLSAGRLRLDVNAHEAYLDGVKLELTSKEFQLLSYMMQNAKRALATDRLLNHVWGYDSHLDTKTLKVHIGQLRKKIESDPANPSTIVTIRGLGYKFDEPLH